MKMALNNGTGNNAVGKRLATTNNSNKTLKITAIGDGMVGKTCLLITYTSKEFPKEYVPTVFDNYPDEIVVDGVNYPVTIWDTAGQEDYERLRPLSYPNTDCFLLCYSVGSKSSYENICSKWFPELKHHCPNVPIILVATKTDLRESDCDTPLITPSQGKKIQRKIKAVKFMECSALKNEGLDEIFKESVKAAIKKTPNRVRDCIVL